MSDEYILRSELIALVGFWFLPPSLIAFFFQLKAFASRDPGLSRAMRALILISTPVERWLRKTEHSDE